ncbi:hypothetical protein FQN50_001558 [Emmonsiellopsis sp. PD_5]|nr:hypothetical protein FQN50_001558 [Emmonsiellopsis sp. PD_5]
MASPEPDSPADASLPDAPPHTQQYKSFKRKYAKRKMDFDVAMRESNNLFKDELRIRELSKRLKEQNEYDQLLEALLELNSTIRVPPSLRYDLDLPDKRLPRLHSPEPETKAPEFLGTDREVLEQLNGAKARLLARELSPEHCRHLEQSLMQSYNCAPRNKFSTLLNVPHKEYTFGVGHQALEWEPEWELDATLGYLSPDHELEYSTALDAAAAGEVQPVEKMSVASREKDAVSRNPVSVINWLKKHKPQDFIHHDAGDTASEKPPPRSTARASKRQSAAQAKKEEDVYDEDGILVEQGASGGAGAGGGGGGRGKRKRDEDGGYRPKGGSGGRARRKKDDAATATTTTTTSKRPKRNSAGGSTA